MKIKYIICRLNSIQHLDVYLADGNKTVSFWASSIYNAKHFDNKEECRNRIRKEILTSSGKDVYKIETIYIK